MQSQQTLVDRYHQRVITEVFRLESEGKHDEARTVLQRFIALHNLPKSTTIKELVGEQNNMLAINAGV